MSEERYTEKFCGIDIFTWTGWDEVDIDVMQFYDVEFIPESMKKYNGSTISKSFEGKIEIYGKDNVVWTGYVTDIKEVMAELNKR